MKLESHKMLLINTLSAISILALIHCSPKIAPTATSVPVPAQIEKSTAASDWDQLFIRNTGWFGGDGIFAIPMDGAEYRPATDKTKTLFVFSDSVVADTIGETITRKDFAMVHNCVAYLDGSEPDSSKFKFFIHKDANGKPTSLFVPKTPHAQPNEYYWMGDGFVNVEMDSTMYIFAYPVKDTIIPGSFFEFDQLGVNIIAIPKGSKPPFTDQRQLETPFFFPLENWSKVTMGSGVLVNTQWAGAPNPDGYIYILGVGGLNNGLVVARVKPKEFEQFDKWEFSKGPEWTTDYKSAKPVTRLVSNELSMSPMADGRFVLAHQVSGIENDVAVQISKSPAGPFFPLRKVWHCREWESDFDYFSYNAKGFPHLSKPGELLIAYNVNSFDFWKDIPKEPRLCRSRFFRLKL
ncbi:MAG: hypothetical protein RIR11_752 [Bacteroidota bacterium]|jgi:hypothetical protein